MDPEKLRMLALSFPGVTEDVKWVDHLCFSVGGKMFLITGLSEVPVTASFKTDEENFACYSKLPGIKPAPYLARYNWLQVDGLKRLNTSDWERLLRLSYDLVFAKLPAGVKKMITRPD